MDTNFIWLGIFINGDWTNADFFYSTDGATWTLAGSETSDTNIPDAAETTDIMPLVISKEVGTTQRDANVDFVGWRYDMVRGQ